MSFEGRGGGHRGRASRWVGGILVAVGVATAWAIPQPGPQSPNVVISQVYGGGGNSGAPYLNDFIELHNPGTRSASLAGFAVQYAAAAGTTWLVTALAGGLVVAPGGYVLIQAAAGGLEGSALPTPDAVSTTSLASTAGKVALTSNSTALTGACPNSGAIVDLVGYGVTATCFENAPAPSPSNTTSIKRTVAMCGDTNANNMDFAAVAPAPRNSSAAPDFCEATVNETGAAQEADYCNLQFPPTISVPAGTATPNIYARIFEAGLTESAGSSAAIAAQIGYGPQGVDPATQAGFVWFSAAFNTQVGNDDEYQVSFTAPAAGTYRYASRFTLDGVNWTYCDLDGAGSNASLDFSTSQLGTMTIGVVLPPFTDDPLGPGVTPIKTVHITELRTRVDEQRVRFGLAGFGWTDAALVAGMPIRAVHVAELRTALQAAYTAAAVSPPAFTDPSLVAGTTSIKAIHIQELRDAVVTLASSTCSNCPGADQPTAIVGCDNGACTFACVGENYDVDHAAANGCEVTDSPLNNHTLLTEVNLGSKSCQDGDVLAVAGLMVNDQRVHLSPSIAGFNSVSGAAPDFFGIHLGGGLCTNDVSLTLTLGAAAGSCYQLSLITTGATYTCSTTSGTCTISQGSGSYVDDTDAHIKVERTCSSATTQSLSYNVSGHF